MVEISKALAVQWKALPDVERAAYQLLATAAKARHHHEQGLPAPLAQGLPAQHSAARRGKRRAAEAGGAVAPVAKPLGAFLLFSGEHRAAVKAEHPELKGVGPIAKVCCPTRLSLR
jgi:hypothetical protein